MEVVLGEAEVVSSKYKLPEVVYHKGSYYLESRPQLEEKRYRKGPYPDYILGTRPSSFSQVIPSAKEVSPSTFLGERRSHPSLRIRVYEVLQH